jgi:hypothetical protein
MAVISGTSKAVSGKISQYHGSVIILLFILILTPFITNG